MIFARLKELRDTLASIPAFAVSADTREELVKAIDALDDEMVADVRAERYAHAAPPKQRSKNRRRR